ncbi:hypothetical protein [Achromobacter anxifer]|uniref:hypothetical protein n=1 Tax=Achromobacter anxifer TaxID=1287737 RepID=UPI0023F65422|nr:hypothetical protein [Achromobacter anxifer]MDF8361769.1 hypothetical protein [Achromobacter anxifer]
MSVHVSECCRCGHRVYRARLWCPACGHGQARTAQVEQAELQAWTELPSKDGAPARIIATVRALPVGPVLVARLEAPPAGEGQRLRLFERDMQGISLPWARALDAGEA